MSMTARSEANASPSTCRSSPYRAHDLRYERARVLTSAVQQTGTWGEDALSSCCVLRFTAHASTGSCLGCEIGRRRDPGLYGVHQCD